jgi:2-keto-4-pentenoate hydratase/2-oxohepta-3-ene-1,7-dioic acid hydratase in catechol pathway
MQHANPGQMVFKVAKIIAHLFKVMTLELCGVIASGTPEGAGVGQKPMVFLQHNDVLRCTITDFEAGKTSPSANYAAARRAVWATSAMPWCP